ncbi:zinc metalloprotease [Jejudonia soesokkakensis]|uniref:Zinc metalloprotease n=1 Tax=Jejudonia soesokkakensis TaxID=1323432 RepID=A0ABW2MXG4_9FLAO
MRKLIMYASLAALTFTACENDPQEENLENQIDMSDFRLTIEETPSAEQGRQCHSMEVLNRQISENPELIQRMYEIEEFTRIQAQIQSRPPGNGNGNGNGNSGGGDPDPDPTGDNLGAITIPVVVHVIYNNANQNISDQQITSQINVLNADFNKSNSDLNQVPSEFSSLIADVDVNFTLDQVIRVSSTRTSWGTNDAMKFSSNGGSDAVSPNTKLNIWVCNIGGGILGYAQFPGGNSATDGVVVGPQFFGTTGFVSAPFDKGRTATHEVGHWLNLRHIWGDGRCNRDDFVNDTPKSDAPNYGCPNYPVNNCRSNDMSMNYMDYVDDACMQMFSEGQKTRMRTIFLAGGPRDSFIP